MRHLEDQPGMFAVIEREQLKRLAAIASQLYREERLNGDQQRDMGHIIMAVLDTALPMPDEDK
jgi:hypothetical protein